MCFVTYGEPRALETGHDLCPHSACCLCALSLMCLLSVTTFQENEHRLLLSIPLTHISEPSGALKAAKYPTHRGGAGCPETGQMALQVSHEQRPQSVSEHERHANRRLSYLEMRKNVFHFSIQSISEHSHMI